MSENTSSEKSTPAGPASLKDALRESFQELSGEEPTAPVVTDDEPTDDDTQLASSDEKEAYESPSEGEPEGDDEQVIPPEHWSAEDKATFEGLPRQAQDYLLKREKQYEQGIQAKSEQLKTIEEAIAPYDQVLKLRGVDRGTAIKSWVAAQQMLDQDPVRGIKMLIQTFGHDVADKISREIGQGEPRRRDYSKYEPDTLEELESLKRDNQNLIERQQRQMQEEAMRKVQEFVQAKDAEGNLKHPQFEQVKPTMQAFLNSGAATDLEDAYSMAVRTLPDYEKQIAEKARKEAEAELKKRREAAAVQAKKAAKAVNGRSTKPPSAPTPKSMKDDLLEAWDQSLRGELNG